MRRKRSFGLSLLSIWLVFSGVAEFFGAVMVYRHIKTFAHLFANVPVTYSNICYTIILVLIFCGVTYIVTGIGIARRRFWAWYLTLAYAVSHALLFLQQGFYFTWQAYSLTRVAIEIAFVIAVFLYSITIKSLFLGANTGFKLKSWYGALIGGLCIAGLLAPLWTLGFKVYTTIAEKQPFIVGKPAEISLAKMASGATMGNGTSECVFNITLAMPENFIRSTAGKDSGLAGFFNERNKKKSAIIIGNKPFMDNLRPSYTKLGFARTFNFEEAFYTSNWNLYLLMMRYYNYLQFDGVESFTTPQLKGFLQYGHKKGTDKWTYCCSVYDADGNGIADVTFLFHDGSLTPADVARVILSIKINKN